MRAEVLQAMKGKVVATGEIAGPHER